MTLAPDSSDAAQRAHAARLNRTCVLRATEVSRVHAYLDAQLATAMQPPALGAAQAHLFSPLPVFVAAADLEQMRVIAAAIARVTRLSGYQRCALLSAGLPETRVSTTGGLMLGFDFHLTPSGPRLIEINTNAGGALLNTAMLRAATGAIDAALATPVESDPSAAEERIARTFFAESSRLHPGAVLRRVAIIDDDPGSQFLAAEFQLFARLLERHGVSTVITDPETLRLKGQQLLCADGPIDLVYNRLTDFELAAPEHRLLRSAAAAGVIVSPNPEAHALFANKRNLALLSNPALLRAWGADETAVDLLTRAIPATEVVRAEAADTLWARRSALFFKPARGFGSRGTYRGDKLTRQTFAAIMAGDYVSQQRVPPGERAIDMASARSLKFDLRLYAYDGIPLLFAARLYQGQTTNFRTPEGGFAPVYVPTMTALG